MKKAFSLIEFAIAIIIIAILLGVIIAYNTMSSSATLTVARSLTKSSPVKDINNLVLWFETTMPQSIIDAEADDNKAVSTWYDLGSNRNNASGATTYIADAINGLPALRFDGTANFFTFNGSSLVNNNYTIFIVEQRHSSTTSGAYIIGGSGVTDNSRLNLGYSSDTAIAFHQYNNNFDAISVVGAYSSPIPRIHSFMFNSATGKDYYLNGTGQTLTGSGSGLNTFAGLTSFDDAVIGQSGVNTGYFNGDIAEIIMFNKALSDDERSDVEQYLSKKWGIAL